MVRRTLNDALAGHKDERVVLRGWVHRRRRLSAVSFLILRDRSGLAQVVVSDDATKAQLDALPTTRRPAGSRSPRRRSPRCPTRPRRRRSSCGGRR